MVLAAAGCGGSAPRDEAAFFEVVRPSELELFGEFDETQALAGGDAVCEGFDQEGAGAAIELIDLRVREGPEEEENLRRAHAFAYIEGASKFLCPKFADDVAEYLP